MVRVKIDGENQRLYQWDVGQRLILEGIPAGTQVDFCRPGGEPMARVTYEEDGKIYVDIPNVTLQSAGGLNAWFYIRDDQRGETVYGWYSFVAERPKPADYVYTEEEQAFWSDLAAEIEEMKKNGGQGTVKSVNGVEPDENGNVEIDALPNDVEQIAMLIEVNMLPSVHDASGAILTDTNGNVILRY